MHAPRTILVVGLVLLLGAADAFGQTGTIRGQVVDATTQAPLPGANVVVEGTERGAATDENGNFEVSGLEPGTYAVRASILGYQPQIRTDVVVRPARPTVVNFELRETAVELEGVEIRGGAFDRDPAAPTSVQALGPEEVRRTPGGQEDISRTLLSLPGMTGGVDNRNDILVRGGGPSENTYILDGIPVPQINHFATQGATGGAEGLINVDFIQDVEFYTGGFPVRYGDALSSVLVIDNRPGTSDRVAGDFTLGAAEAALTLDGPLLQDRDRRSDWIFSVRRSYLQFLFQALDLPIRPSYWDAQTKLVHEFDSDNRLTLVGLGAINNFDIVTDEDDSFENQETARRVVDNDQWTYTGGAVWRHLLDSGVLNVRLSRSTTDFQFADDDPEDDPVLRNSSRETETRLQADLDYRVASDLTVSAGAGVTRGSVETSFFERARPGTPFAEDLEFGSELGLWRGFGFGQATKRWFDERLSTTAGVRVDGTSFLDRSLYVSPRLSASLQLSSRWSINAATGIFRQPPEYIALVVRDEDGRFANDDLSYIRADHYIGGLAYEPTESTRFTLEGFYKDYQDYPVSATDPRVSLANQGGDFGFVGAEPLTDVGVGRAYGLELFGQKKLMDRWYGLASYTLAWSEFSGADGVLRPSDWDVRHTVSLTGGYQIGERWTLGAKWRIFSGRPFTPFDEEASAEEYEISGRGVPDRDRLNSERVPAYHRLDVRVDRRFSFDSWNAVVYLDIQNIYSRTNVFGFRYTEDPEIEDNRRPIENVSLLPTFGFSIEW